MQIDFGGFNNALARVPSAGEAFQLGQQQAQQRRRQAEQEQALGALSRDPDDPAAREALWRSNPAVASQYETHAQKRAETQREGEARSALSDWMLGGGMPGNALAGPPVATPQPSAFVAATNALRPQAGGAPPVPVQPTNDRYDAHPSGQGMARGSTLPAAGGSPSAADGPAWERYVRADPAGAMKSLLGKQQLTKAQNEAMFTQMDMIGRLARGAVDQASYDAALQQARGMGVDVSSLPPRFDPAAVNAIELQALSAKEYLAEQRAERRLEWDIDDDQIDNQRADRALEDLSGYRGEQIGLGRERIATSRRGQDLTDTRGRRGQDVSSRDRQRGQDLSNARGIRGQDLTDKRGRESASFRGNGGRGGAPTARIVDPKNGRAAILKNGKWVDEQTGRPIE